MKTAHLIALFGITVSMAAFARGTKEIPAIASDIKTYGNGELRFIEDIPFLELSGSYFEMGEQYGVLLRDELHEIHSELLPYGRTWEAKFPDDIGRKLVELSGDNFIQQLKGMAAGSGLSFHDLLLGAYLGIIERAGCSSILVRIKDENSSRLIHGRNFDYGKGTGKYPVLIEYRPERQYKHLIIGTIGSAGLAEGMNAKGITVSQNLAPGDLKQNIISHAVHDVKLREILSFASSLRQVEALMQGFAMDVGCTFTVGSGLENDGIIYDIHYDDVKKNYFDGQDYLFATNSYVSEVLNPVRDDLRYQIISDYMKKDRVNSIDGMIKLLSDPGTTIGVNMAKTIHSVVFDPMKKIVYMAFHTNFAAWSQWLAYDWEKDSFTIYRKAETERLSDVDSAELTEVYIIGAYWNGNLPVLDGGVKTTAPTFWVEIRDSQVEKGVEQLYDFKNRAAKEIILKAENEPDDVVATVTEGTIAMEGFRGFMFRIKEADLQKMKLNIPYTMRIENTSAVYRWIVEDGVVLIRPE